MRVLALSLERLTGNGGFGRVICWVAAKFVTQVAANLLHRLRPICWSGCGQICNTSCGQFVTQVAANLLHRHNVTSHGSGSGLTPTQAELTRVCYSCSAHRIVCLCVQHGASRAGVRVLTIVCVVLLAGCHRIVQDGPVCLFSCSCVIALLRRFID